MFYRHSSLCGSSFVKLGWFACLQPSFNHATLKVHFSKYLNHIEHWNIFFTLKVLQINNWQETRGAWERGGRAPYLQLVPPKQKHNRSAKSPPDIFTITRLNFTNFLVIDRKKLLKITQEINSLTKFFKFSLGASTTTTLKTLRTSGACEVDPLAPFALPINQSINHSDTLARNPSQ